MYLTDAHMLTWMMHSSDPSWRIGMRRGHFFSSLESRSKTTRVLSRTAIAATSSGEGWLCLLRQRQLNVRIVSTKALSVPRINSMHKHPKMLALLHYDHELIF